MNKKIKKGDYVPYQCKTPEDYAECIKNIAKHIPKDSKPTYLVIPKELLENE